MQSPLISPFLFPRFSSAAAIAAWLLLASATAFAAEGKSPQPARSSPVVTRPAGAFQAAWLSLAGAGEPCRVFLAWREGKPVQFWSTKIQLPGGPKPQGTPKLLVDGLRGNLATVETELRLVSVWAPQQRLALQTLALNLTSAGRQLSGAWTLKSDGKEVSKGTVTGELRPDTDGIAAGQDWPAFHGVMSACAGPGYGKPLVADLAAARPVWRSEAASLSGWGTGADARYRERAAFGTLCGGSSSPVVANGMIYLYHYLPSGDVAPEGADAAIVAKFRDHPVEHEAMRRWYSKRADVVVTAIDGATGRTVWQSVWPGKQGNYQTHKWRGLNPTPAISGGVLVVADYGHGLHAFDAKTGELKWSRGGGETVTKDRAPLGPVICDGVVVYAAGKDTLGLDLASGRELWKAPGGESARRMLLAGKERVLVLGGKSSLLDPASGKVLWSSEIVTKDKLFTVTMPVCEGDRAIFYTATSDKETGKVLAYTVTDTGIERAWESEQVTWDENLVMCIAHGRVYVAGKKEGLRALDLATGKALGSIPELKCGSNAGIVALDDRLFYQPEGQHGRQQIHLVDAAPGRFAPLGTFFTPQHNDTTAYGQMTIANVIVDGRLIVRGMDGTYCYDLRKP